MDRAPLLIVFGGLPGVGKTVLGRALALHLGAVYLRIDSIEQAMVQSDSFRQPLEDAGYRVAYFLAEDNLRLGRIVVADCVNPIAITRDSWVAIGKTAQAPIIEIEVLCSDPEEHCRRVEGRCSDIPGLRLPTWSEVLAREYEAWQRKHLVLDTAGRTVEQSITELLKLMENS